MTALVDAFGQHFFRLALIEAVMVGAVAGAVGVHVLLRRLPFFVVAMSHATFPGVVFGSLLGVSLFAGGALFGVAVALVVVALGALGEVDDSSAIGIVLAGSFAVGVLVLSAQPSGSKDLSAFLVGSIVTVTRGDLVTTTPSGPPHLCRACLTVDGRVKSSIIRCSDSLSSEEVASSSTTMGASMRKARAMASRWR